MTAALNPLAVLADIVASLLAAQVEQANQIKGRRRRNSNMRPVDLDLHLRQLLAIGIERNSA